MFFLFFFDTFSTRLKDTMEKQHLNVYALAILTGVSVITVKRWLNGTYEPRHVNLPKIADALHVPVDYLCPHKK